MPASANGPQSAGAANQPFPMPAGANGPNLFRRPLTIVGDRAPTVVAVPERRLSGAAWWGEFPASTDIDDLAPPFRENVSAFVSALRSAGAGVTINNTVRPPERAFLMHYSWRIVNEDFDPRDVPEREGINIRWDHTDENGNYSAKASVAAARAMVIRYEIGHLGVPPALSSRHIRGEAIDMTIGWTGRLTLVNGHGRDTDILTTPRDEMNSQLHDVGASYGVIKFRGRGDRPHWSNDGR